MRNDINATTTNDILARALKARDRRDRDGKKRRPVTDGLIEYAKEQTNLLDVANEYAVKINKDLADALEANAAYAAKVADLEREIANERAKLAEIAEKVA